MSYDLSDAPKDREFVGKSCSISCRHLSDLGEIVFCCKYGTSLLVGFEQIMFARCKKCLAEKEEQL